ncbi:MAG: pyridoxal phosphate-dependent aminotransferase [Myxococcales bacterium]|nr:aminotransferase class I/II-fold pyridoxal phosphate-dependent enzyme [Myxococcales bacterium]
MMYADRVARLGTENAFRLGPMIAQAESRGLRVIRCNIGEPDFPLPDHIRDEIKRQLDAGNTHYCEPQGVLSLRDAVARHMRAQGIDAAPERVVIFPGAKVPIGFAQQTYANPGDEIIYPSPGFPIYESFTGFIDAVPVPLYLREDRGFAFAAEDLARLITPRTRLVYLNFPSNPTGGVPSPEDLDGIAEVLRTRLPPGARVFSDEIYEDIVFDGGHRSIAALPGMSERTIVVSGVSKSYAWTGGRVGWALLPTVAEAQVFRNLNINYFSCVAAYTQEAARVALDSPLRAPTLKRMVDSFRERRDLVVEGLSRVEGIRCALPPGAFYVWPNVRGVCEKLGVFAAHGELPEDERARTTPVTLFQMFLLMRHGVATLDRKSFGRIGADREQFLRLSVATGIADLREAVQRIAQAARDRAGFEAFIRETAQARPW